MNLKRIGTTLIAFALLAGGGSTNITYATKPQEQPLVLQIHTEY